MGLYYNKISMPKIHDFPVYSVSDCIELAKVVFKTEGPHNKKSCAAKLNRSVSGDFNALISSSVKYGVLLNKKDTLQATPLFSDFRLAYTPKEEKGWLRKMVLSIPVFKTLIDTVSEDTVRNEALLMKMLSKDYKISDRNAKKVARAFADNYEIAFKETDAAATVSAPAFESVKIPGVTTFTGMPSDTSSASTRAVDPAAGYRIEISGPNLEIKFTLRSANDMKILSACLEKMQMEFLASV